MSPGLVRSVWGRGELSRWGKGRGLCEGREKDVPPTAREVIAHGVTSPWHSATRRATDHGEINSVSCLAAPLCPPQKHHSHTHSEVVIEVHLPFEEQLDGLLVAMDILSPVKAKPCLKDSKRYRRMYC